MSDAYRVKPSEIRALSPAARTSLSAWIARVDARMPGDGASVPNPAPLATTREDRPIVRPLPRLACVPEECGPGCEGDCDLWETERVQTVIRWDGGSFTSQPHDPTDGTHHGREMTTRIAKVAAVFSRPVKVPRAKVAPVKRERKAPAPVVSVPADAPPAARADFSPWRDDGRLAAVVEQARASMEEPIALETRKAPVVPPPVVAPAWAKSHAAVLAAPVQSNGLPDLSTVCDVASARAYIAALLEIA